ncbi:threonine aldolase family protein [Marinobacterium rhizophilum]|uniref:threonine aldolase family protein n=1 Tax=Marinobacterium rhizophilum TaxID=420402 RepID=UPI000369597D|nr:beta-eliminating lyase-related protein [Marinobacterium rhizophilum]
MENHYAHLLASDNVSGVHPEVMAKLAEVNRGHVPGYGADAVTAAALEQFRAVFGENSETLLLFNGTAANVLALKGMLQSHEALFCAEEAHLQVDECGAPEHYIGCKLIPVPAMRGKLTLARIEQLVAADLDVVHRSQPRVISLAQATERGAVYSLEELRAIGAFARQRGLLLHMDGARLANAVQALGVSFAEIVEGFDVLSFGGTKNGLMMAEAVVVLNPALRGAYPYIRKQGMQLASKQRFLAAQFLAYFENDLWRRNAGNANAMARRLASGLGSLNGVTLSAPVEINMVFAQVPTDWLDAVQRLTPCLVWPGDAFSEIRLVTSFDTRAEDIDNFVREFGRLSAR